MPKKYEALLNRIFVIESLPANNTRTGELLFSGCLKLNVIAGKGPRSVLLSVATKEELVAAFESIRADTATGQLNPMIHLEMHGATDASGLVLSSMELITWEELTTTLRTINSACRNNLLLSIAACSGAHVFETLLTFEDHAPFWGVVAPWHPVSVGDIENFSRFFETLFQDGNLKSALQALNEYIPIERRFHFYNAEGMFERYWRAYERRNANPQHRYLRVQSLMGQALSKIEVRQTYTLPQLRNELDAAVDAAQVALKQEMRNRFLGVNE